MKLYGYDIESSNIEDIAPKELSEITLVANAEELRKIADFIHLTAENMEQMGDAYDHEHLSDVDEYFEQSPHIVVAKPQY